MADKVIDKKQALLDNSVIERLVDNQLVDLIHELPDPDVILRKANIDQDVYREIMADPHVIGEIRPLRAALLKQKFELVAGDDSQQAQKALELSKLALKKRPDVTMSQKDLIWSIGKSPLFGRRVHAVEWIKDGTYIVPNKIFDISTQSYAFNHAGELLIRTIDNPQGEPAEDMHWLVTRHMADRQNPYGLAILSTCFWPWMFKNGGFKFFVKFCEKFGIPWPVAKYPQGTTDNDIEDLVERLKNMLEDAVAGVPEGTEIDLLEVKTSGESPQERLIKICNSEMSKAITSQTLATEIHGGGSRAAAETHQGRTDVNGIADRELVSESLEQICGWITELNFGANVAPPSIIWDDKKQRNTSDVEYFKKASELVPVRQEDIYKSLELSQPGKGDEVVFNPSQTVNNNEEPPINTADFAKPDQEFNAEDLAISDIVDQVKSAIDAGDTLEQALDAIVSLLPELERDALNDLVRNELELSFGTGMVEAD